MTGCDARRGRRRFFFLGRSAKITGRRRSAAANSLNLGVAKQEGKKKKNRQRGDDD